MKKILAAALCLLTISGSALAQSVPKELQTAGSVTGRNGDMITITNDNKKTDRQKNRQRSPAHHG